MGVAEQVMLAVAHGMGASPALPISHLRAERLKGPLWLAALTIGDEMLDLIRQGLYLRKLRNKRRELPLGPERVVSNEQSGAQGCARFGRMTDGGRTPWAEWYGDAKIRKLFGPGFDLAFGRNFGQNGTGYHWFEVVKHPV